MGDDGVPSDEQWNYLMDVIAYDEEMLTNQFNAPNGKIRLKRKWNELAIELNQLGGAVENGERWKEAFANMKGRARKQYANRVAYMEGTGGGEHPDALGLGMNPIYARCVTITGQIAAVGNLSVPEPLLLQQQDNCVEPQGAGQPRSAPSSNNQRNVAGARSRFSYPLSVGGNKSYPGTGTLSLASGSGLGHRATFSTSEASLASGSGLGHHAAFSSRSEAFQASGSGLSFRATFPTSEASQANGSGRSYNAKLPTINEASQASGSGITHRGTVPAASYNVGPQNKEDGLSKLAQGWKTAAQNAQRFCDLQKNAESFLDRDMREDVNQFSPSAQGHMASSHDVDMHVSEDDCVLLPETPQGKKVSKKQLHTPPWDGVSPARKKLSFKEDSSSHASNVGVMETAKSFQKMNLSNESGNDSGGNLKDAIDTNTEVLQIVHASLAGVIDALNNSVSSITSSLDAMAGLRTEVEQLHTDIVTMELTVQMNTAQLQNLNSSLSKDNVFIEGVNFAVISADAENKDK